MSGVPDNSVVEDGGHHLGATTAVGRRRSERGVDLEGRHLQLTETASPEVRIRLIQERHGRHKHNRCVTTSREQDAVGVPPKPQWIAYLCWVLIAAGKSIGPRVVLPDQVGPPCEKACVEFKTLASELGHARSQLATRSPSRIVVAFGKPRPVLDTLGRLKVVHYPEPDEVPILRRGDQSVPRAWVVGVSIAKVSLGHVKVAGDPKVIAALVELPPDLLEIGVSGASPRSVWTKRWTSLARWKRSSSWRCRAS